MGAANCKDEKTEHKHCKRSGWADIQEESKLWLTVNTMRLTIRINQVLLRQGFFKKGSNLWKNCKFSVIAVFEELVDKYLMETIELICLWQKNQLRF